MQCSAVKPRVLTFMWMQLEMQHPHTIADQAHLLMVTTFLDSGDLRRRTIYPATPQKMLRNGLMNMKKCSRHQPGLNMYRISIWSGICETCSKRSDPWRSHLPTHWTWRMPWCQTPQDTQRFCVFASMGQVQSTVEPQWTILVPMDVSFRSGKFGARVNTLKSLPWSFWHSSAVCAV